ncbi:hypothetical protein NGM37_10585, partial [Streptomyces sp. TRM76130]|nr:hypothetical protein [Streptomyces sp. TRM76130]
MVSQAAGWITDKAKSAIRWSYNRISSAVSWITGALASTASSAAAWARQKAEAAVRAAVERGRAVTRKAKQAVAKVIKYNPLPALIEGTRPLIKVASDIVSTTASLPAKVANITVDVIADTAREADEL